MQEVSVPGLSMAERVAFRHRLMQWYGEEARVLPWRGVRDPYRTWVSEVMLQQTRVAAVLAHYEDFLRLFPSIVALALAREEDVLAAWSGLGYYRRARMLHKAAQFCVQELGGRIPESSVELRTLPGVGEYTCAAIASIAYGESVAVVDGNVERVLLRVTGRAEEHTAKAKAFVRAQAGLLVPERRMTDEVNVAGDHNQAMMELGATICLPRGPLCLNCPVYELCRTKGEHVTVPRGKQRSQRAAYLLATRRRDGRVEVLLERRSQQASLMAGMMELPMLPLDVVEGMEPALRVRHSITNTNYYVEVYAEDVDRRGGDAAGLRKSVPAARTMLQWAIGARLRELPLTGLARKVLMRMDLMAPTGGESEDELIAARLA